MPASNSSSKVSNRKLWYRQPSLGDWNAALPIGSGRLGAMIFGNVTNERIELNEDSLWSGGPRDRINPDALKQLPEIRRRILSGDHSANTLVTEALSGIPDIMRHYVPLGRLNLVFHHPALAQETEGDLSMVPSLQVQQIPKGIANYYRELDLEAAVAKVTYEVDGVTFTRECFASAPDQVIVLRFTSTSPGSINFRLQFERGPYENYAARFFDTIVPVEGAGLLVRGRESGEGAVGFAAAIRASVESGVVSVIGETLIVEDASEVLLVFAASTTFRENDPAQVALLKTKEAIKKGYAALRDCHIEEYRGWFDRATIALDESDDNSSLPTDERLRKLQNGATDLALVTLYFDFGRYLLISSSRPGSLPPNLQGIWNQDFFPAWGGKYTININTEMNYWPAQVCGLADLQEPLFALLERLRISGAEVARRMYGCRGFVVHHNTDLWADACPVDRNLAASFWPLGGAWLSLHLWEQYNFNRDRAFLQRAYPILKEASLFFVDFLQRDNQGRLVLNPSTSPENVYRLANGKAATLCAGCTMDTEILNALFSSTILAARVLGEDKGFAVELEDTRQSLPTMNIGKHGQLMEWLEDYDETDLHHRHISHLFALYPWNAITPSGTPQLADACRVSLERRGDPSSGWSLAWKIGCWARLGDGDRAERLLRILFRPVAATQISYHGDGGSYPNLLCAHPPFQIDGNLGGTAAIVEMLIQSHLTVMSLDGNPIPCVQILPALPTAWQQGHASGLHLRGNLCATFSWSSGQLEKITLLALGETTVLLRYSIFSRELTLKSGQSISLDAEMEDIGH